MPEHSFSPTIETMKLQKYLLKVGGDGESRLNILNEVFNPFSHRFLETLDIQEGMHVLEIGCGTGEMTRWFSHKVGPSGKVIAIDISKEQIDIARKHYESSGLNNITFHVMDAYDIKNLSRSFDIIYCRFVLAHIRAPKEILALIYQLLKEGGKLACEESSVNASFCYPANAAFKQWVTVWNGLKRRHNLLIEIGTRLPHMVRSVGYKNVNCTLIQPVLKTPREKSLLRLTLSESLDNIISSGLLSLSEVDRCAEDLKKMEKNDDLFIGFLRNSQVSATR